MLRKVLGSIGVEVGVDVDNGSKESEFHKRIRQVKRT